MHFGHSSGGSSVATWGGQPATRYMRERQPDPRLQRTRWRAPLSREAAWIELYEKRNGTWLRVGNVSSFRP
jgi:hypothetical protein